jgi:glutamine synthetase
MICSIVDPMTHENIRATRVTSPRSPRALQRTGIADTAYVGPEAEFFI